MQSIINLAITPHDITSRKLYLERFQVMNTLMIQEGSDQDQSNQDSGDKEFDKPSVTT